MDKKMWYIYTVEYYSATKRNETGSFAGMWMNLESVIQSEVSQKEKSKYQHMHMESINNVLMNLVENGLVD